MRKKHLRDIKDYFKGWIIAVVSNKKVHEPLDLRVIPMLTDDPTANTGKWTVADWAVYAHLLNVGTNDVLLKDRHLVYIRDRQAWQGLTTTRKQQARQAWADERRDYFEAALAAHAGDFFIDPDTGICTPNSEQLFPLYRGTTGSERIDHSYVYRSELARLTEKSSRVVIVFQDAHRGKGYLAGVVDAFKPAGMTGLRHYGAVVPAPPKLFAFAYDAVHSCAVFVCRDKARLDKVKSGIKSAIPAALAAQSIFG